MNIPKNIWVYPGIIGHFRNLNWRYLPYFYKAYIRGYAPKIWPHMVQYLHFRILKFPLMVCLGPKSNDFPNRSRQDLESGDTPLATEASSSVIGGCWGSAVNIHGTCHE